jgi:hypothetical protein
MEAEAGKLDGRADDVKVALEQEILEILIGRLRKHGAPRSQQLFDTDSAWNAQRFGCYGSRAKFSVAEAVQSTVLSLPEDFDLTEQQAQALQSDDVIPGASLDLGVFDSGTRIAKARNAAAERGDRPAANARHLVWFLVLLAGMGLSDNRRAPFVYYTAGNFADGSPWREPLPAYLTDRHVAVLVTLIGVVKTAGSSEHGSPSAGRCER